MGEFAALSVACEEFGIDEEEAIQILENECDEDLQ